MNRNGHEPFSKEDGLAVLVEKFLLRKGVSPSEAQTRLFAEDRCTVTFPASTSPLGERTVEVMLLQVTDYGGRRVIIHGMVGGVRSTVSTIRN